MGGAPGVLVLRRCVADVPGGRFPKTKVFEMLEVVTRLNDGNVRNFYDSYFPHETR